METRAIQFGQLSNEVRHRPAVGYDVMDRNHEPVLVRCHPEQLEAHKRAVREIKWFGRLGTRGSQGLARIDVNNRQLQRLTPMDDCGWLAVGRGKDCAQRLMTSNDCLE